MERNDFKKHFKPFNDTASVVMEESEKPLTAEQQSPQTSIKHWAEEDRPREKLMAKGAEALTNAELLAILIGSGTPKKSAVELMKEIMQACDNRLSNLSKMSVKALTGYNGIGEAKAITIIAAAEIGRRRAKEKSSDMAQMREASAAYEYMRPYVQDLNHEESWALMLNNSARLLKLVHLSSGGLTETSVDVRMLLKEALLSDATCFILVHNHPSGSMRPSSEDTRLTERVRKAGETMNIRMLDHIIVTDGGYYSFAEEGRL